VGDAKPNAEWTSIPNESLTHNIASCQQVAEEQQSDEASAGCFKLAKAGKAGQNLRSMTICYITGIIPSGSCSKGKRHSVYLVVI